MKKVLALVLAVIMVCTMAMAVQVVAPDASAVGSSTIPALKESDPTETYGVEIAPTYYVVSGFENNVFTASNVTLAKTNNAVYVVVPTLDKALDGEADFTFTGTIKIADKNNAGTYVILGIKNGKLVATEGKKAGVTMSDDDLTRWNANVSNKISEKYDIGFNTYVLTSDEELANAITGLVAGNNYGSWFIATKTLTYTANNVTVKVPAKTVFKMKAPAAYTGNALDTVKDNSYTGFAGLFVEGNGITMNFKVTPADNTHFYYAVDKDGNLYDLGAKLTESKNVDGSAYTGTVSASFGGTYQIVKFSKAMATVGTVPGVAATTTPAGTTTNPGTGANDVVGVAAALAVVALVSGAAISLKK